MNVIEEAVGIATNMALIVFWFTFMMVQCIVGVEYLEVTFTMFNEIYIELPLVMYAIYYNFTKLDEMILDVKMS